MPPGSTTGPRRCSWPTRPGPATSGCARWPGSSPPPSPAWTRASWGSGRCPRSARCSSGPGWQSRTWTSWSSTRPSPPSRSPASTSWGWIQPASTSTAVRSRWVIRWAPRARAWSRCSSTSWSGPAVAMGLRPCASASARGSPPWWSGSMADPLPTAVVAAARPRRLAGFARRLRMASTLAGRAALAPVYRAYTVRLRAEVLARPVPEHVALIRDANRRWARQLGGGVGIGHRHGANKAIELLDWCSDLGIREVTLWPPSLENLARAPEEVEMITEIARQTLTALSERDKVKRLEMSLRVIGRRELLPDRLREAAERGEAETQGRPGLRVTLALGYSGRDELVEAARAAIRTLVAQGVAPDQLPDALTAEQLEAHLYTRGSSDPDPIIRTSGEVRLSGFLPWQSAYSEFYFCEAYWPAFRELDFLRAIRTYQLRGRRFGR